MPMTFESGCPRCGGTLRLREKITGLEAECDNPGCPSHQEHLARLVADDRRFRPESPRRD